MNRYVYADNAATTPVSDEVLAAMLPWLKEGYGNPSSIHRKGREAAKAVRLAREQVAAGIGASPGEICFTSCGTEANNWAIKSAARSLAKKGKKHIVTTSFEHPAVLNPLNTLKKEGFEVTHLGVGHLGVVNTKDVAEAIREDTALVTIMYANNEIGTIQPIPEIGALCRKLGVLFHTDAVQAIGNVPVDVAAQQIDLLSFSGHKLHAPKGVGALYIRKGASIPSLIDGGGQESGRRAGTENVAGIVGFGVALERACTGIEERTAKVKVLRDRLIDGILALPRTRLNGDRERRLCGNVNVSIEGVEGESLLLHLDLQGIAASSGSACASSSIDPSHVLLALGVPVEVAHCSLRLSLSHYMTGEDVDYILSTILTFVKRLRGMSPLWESMNQ